MFLLLSFAPQGAGANAFVRCVQNQLSELGHDPGAPDGVLGKNTRRALASFLAETEEFAGLPKLTKRFSVTWCRQIGEAHARLKSHYPSQEAALIEGDDGEGSFQAALMKDSLTSFKNWLQIYHKIELASKVDVIGASDAKRLATRLRALQRQKKMPRTPTKSVQARCKPKDGLSGVAYLNEIAICFKTAPKFDAAWYASHRLTVGYVVAHEYFHQVQRELAADKLPIYYKKSKGPPKPHLRPSWMVEGSADYFAAKWIGYRFRKEISFDTMMKEANASKRTLRQIAKLDRLSAAEDYYVSRFAVRLLGQKFSAKAFLQYFEAVGMGQKHAAAFKSIFGMTETEYSAQFEKMRHDKSEILAFLENES